MFKTLTTVILTALGVLFGIQNFDHVPVYLLWGKAVNMRLIFIIAIAGIGGYLIRHFVGLAREDRLKRQIYAERQNSTHKLKKGKMANKHDEVEL